MSDQRKPMERVGEICLQALEAGYITTTDAAAELGIPAPKLSEVTTGTAPPRGKAIQAILAHPEAIGLDRDGLTDLIEALLPVWAHRAWEENRRAFVISLARASDSLASTFFSFSEESS